MTDAVASQNPWLVDVAVRKKEPDPDGLVVAFAGGRGALFWLAFKTGFFTIITLGFYRFWMKTRLRRWYWSSIRPGGHPMEYVGDPFEKLLGFFIAVVILTFYIGIVNLVLMFVSFSIFSNSWVGYLASFAGVIPLWFYAQYRARRYVLARTRWRGVRFGLEKGAWGFAIRALMHWAITLCTLGILWPRMTFSLEKYRTDRTFFGSAKLHQGGRWPMLYRAAIPFVLALLFCGGVLAWLFWWQPVFPQGSLDLPDTLANFEELLEGGAPIGLWIMPGRLFLIPLGLSALLYGAIHYRFAAKRMMAQRKWAEGIAFASHLSGPRVVSIYVFGNFFAYLALVLGIIILFILAAITMGPEVILGFQTGGFLDLPRWASLSLLGVTYLSVFLMWGVMLNTFVTFPLMRHMALTTSVPVINGLAAISQRDRDSFAEAEGFAEALDLGAAI